jgi:hypothetical protein
MKPIYLLVLIPVFFVAMWAGVTTLLAFLSGWTSLARSYRGSLSSVAANVSMQSAVMRRFGIPVSYRHILNVAVGAEGVQLSVHPLFSLASPPLLIPWSDMAECRNYRALGMFERFGFRPARCDVKIALAGSAARLLTEELAGENPQRPALATA